MSNVWIPYSANAHHTEIRCVHCGAIGGLTLVGDFFICRVSCEDNGKRTRLASARKYRRRRSA